MAPAAGSQSRQVSPSTAARAGPRWETTRPTRAARTAHAQSSATKSQGVPHRVRRRRGAAADVATTTRARAPASLRPQTRGVVTFTHAHDMFTQKKVGGAMLPHTPTARWADAPRPSIAHAADSSKEVAGVQDSYNRAVCGFVSVFFQTRPPPCTRCVGRAGGARRCACCVAFRAAVARQQNHRSACAFTIHECVMLLKTLW